MCTPVFTVLVTWSTVSAIVLFPMRLRLSPLRPLSFPVLYTTQIHTYIAYILFVRIVFNFKSIVLIFIIYYNCLSHSLTIRTPIVCRKIWKHLICVRNSIVGARSKTMPRANEWRNRYIVVEWTKRLTDRQREKKFCCRHKQPEIYNLAISFVPVNFQNKFYRLK